MAIHGSGLVGLARFLRVETRHTRDEHLHPSSVDGWSTLVLAVLGIVAFRGVEIWLYTFANLAIDAVGNSRAAVYFSSITYGAIGYSDELMAERLRLVAAIEGINGILMIGWSTAFLARIAPLSCR